MAFTTCSVATNNISTLDDMPNDVGGLTAAELKAAFDKFGAEFVEWFNETHVAELDGLAGEGHTDETVKGIADALDTHKNDDASQSAKGHVQLGTTEGTALEGVHVNEIAAHAELEDRTVTVGVDKDFATVQEAIDSIKKYVAANITIQVDAGTYNEVVEINGFVGWGRLTLQGGTDTVSAKNYIVSGVRINYNSITVNITGLKYNRTDLHRVIVDRTYVYVRYCVSEDAFNYSAVQSRYGANVRVDDCVISNSISGSWGGLQVSSGGVMNLSNNTGSGNSVALTAEGGIIFKRGTQPEGTTAEYLSSGGQIF